MRARASVAHEVDRCGASGSALIQEIHIELHHVLRSSIVQFLQASPSSRQLLAIAPVEVAVIRPMPLRLVDQLPYRSLQQLSARRSGTKADLHRWLLSLARVGLSARSASETASKNCCDTEGPEIEAQYSNADSASKDWRNSGSWAIASVNPVMGSPS